MNPKQVFKHETRDSLLVSRSRRQRNRADEQATGNGGMSRGHTMISIAQPLLQMLEYPNPITPQLASDTDLFQLKPNFEK